MNRTRSKGFIRPHHSKLQAMARTLDLALIVASLYLSLRLYNVPLDREYVLPCLTGAALFGIFAENNELYEPDWRGAPLFDESLRILFSWLGAFTLLISGVFLYNSEYNFSLQAMDKLDAKMDTAIFAAIHEQRIKLTDLSSITDWVSKQGVNGKDFSDMYTSFGIGSKMKNAEQATVAYNISGVPTLIIDGKYTVLGNDHNVQLATADQLIEMVRAARGMPVPVTKQAASSSSSSNSGESKKAAHKPIAKASSAKDQSKRAG